MTEPDVAIDDFDEDDLGDRMDGSNLLQRDTQSNLIMILHVCSSIEPQLPQFSSPQSFLSTSLWEMVIWMYIRSIHLKMNLNPRESIRSYLETDMLWEKLELTCARDLNFGRETVLL
jgi:hypothetical protein